MTCFNLIVDVGSHSLKLYLKDELNNSIKLQEVITLRILEKEYDKYLVESVIANLSERFSTIGKKIAIGTEALRKNNEIRKDFEVHFQKYGFEFKTISQEEEAKLILTAIRNENKINEYDVVNAGGGSIQIINCKTEKINLCHFGISYLNKEFNLTSNNISDRKISECIHFLEKNLAIDMNKFIYTGGEKTYLEKFSILEIGSDLCSSIHFRKFSLELFNFDNKKLMLNSPYDPEWMLGAVASNCIVLSLLNLSQSDHFLASDLNISHGLLIAASKI